MSGSTTEREHIVRDRSWSFEYKSKSYSLVQGIGELRRLNERIEEIGNERDSVFYAIGGSIVYVAGLWIALASEANLTVQYVIGCALAMLVAAWLGGGVLGFFLSEFLPENLFLKVDAYDKAIDDRNDMRTTLESEIRNYLAQRYSTTISNEVLKDVAQGTHWHFSAQVNGQYQQVYIQHQGQDLVLMRSRKEYTVYEEV